MATRQPLAPYPPSRSPILPISILLYAEANFLRSLFHRNDAVMSYRAIPQIHSFPTARLETQGVAHAKPTPSPFQPPACVLLWVNEAGHM
ncbi:hypothetical protein P691DRAFT_807128 [Macrolepiota fuliginosa MF-IS2]|uniref:Uncharacterized protein n=1 Tax=Macrolepiota fuliginosa MF-IS2 TaxID=1400762 RepID=A0A9P6C0H0_9AGAR|nr:hypothetical protein P691DRAFT_807128 [Macrolepiota fuliginosa MF-IS2]